MTKGRPSKCPHCGSNATRAKGYRMTVTMGIRKRRICKDCNRMFTAGNPPTNVNPAKTRKKRKSSKKK